MYLKQMAVIATVVTTMVGSVPHVEAKSASTTVTGKPVIVGTLLTETSEFETKELPKALEVKVAKYKVKELKTVATTEVEAPNLDPELTSGNLYDWGNCTWYVKNRRPGLPNNLGHATTWYARATSMGMSTGLTPRVGAVAASSLRGLGHVAIVTSISGDNIGIIEMNKNTLGVITEREVPASDYRYIYVY